MRREMALAVLGACQLAYAGPLETALVPADTDWLVHVDMERVANSKLMKSLPGALELEEPFEHMHQVGVDPHKDIRSVTLYGWGRLEEERGVMIVDGSENLTKALWQIAAAEQVRVVEEGERTYYMIDDDGESYAIVAFAHDGGSRLVISREREQVDAAMKQRGDRAPVIGDGPSEGSLVFISARDAGELIPDHDDEFHSTLVRAAEGLVFELSEHDDRVAGRLQVAIADTERTRDMAQMLQGVLAFGRMALRDNEDLEPVAELASHVTISEENSQVKIAFDVPIDLISKVLESHCEMDAKHEGDDGE